MLSRRIRRHALGNDNERNAVTEVEEEEETQGWVARKELMKKKKGIVATGGMSSKPDANFLELKKKSATSLQCPYCDRDPFKQRDRLKMHIERHHKEELEKESGEGGKVDAKDAGEKMLAQKQKDLLEVKLAEKSKQQRR